MTASEITDKNQSVADILTNFEQQLKRDYKSFERERQQNVLITKLNYEQQLHIHDLNLESFNVANQRQAILDKALGLDVQVKVAQVKDTLKDLQEQLAQQCQSLTERGTKSCGYKYRNGNHNKTKRCVKRRYVSERILSYKEQRANTRELIYDTNTIGHHSKDQSGASSEVHESEDRPSLYNQKDSRRSTHVQEKGSATTALLNPSL
jgi:hypothetical protein